MSKLYILIVSLLISFYSGGQIKKGALFTGGDFNYSTNRAEFPTSSTKSTSFHIRPVLGFAFKENLVTGMSVSYTNNRAKQEPGGPETVHNSIGIGAFLRKYIRIKSSDFSVFVNNSIDAVFTKSKTLHVSNEPKSNSIEIPLSIYPGISFRLNKVLQFETGFNSFFTILYRHQDVDQAGITTTYNNFDVTLNMFNINEHLYFGIRVFLNN